MPAWLRPPTGGTALGNLIAEALRERLRMPGTQIPRAAEPTALGPDPAPRVQLLWDSAHSSDLTGEGRRCIYPASTSKAVSSANSSNGK